MKKIHIKSLLMSLVVSAFVIAATGCGGGGKGKATGTLLGCANFADPSCTLPKSK